MKCNASRVVSALVTFSFLSIAGLLTACSTSDSVDVADTEKPVPSDEEGEDVVDGRFPVDKDQDDRLGLIISGLNGSEPSELVSPWLVSSRHYRNGREPVKPGNAIVELTRYVDMFPVQRHIDFYTEKLDTCLIRDQTSTAEEEEQENPPPLSIDGGGELIINTQSGPWFTFPRRRYQDGSIDYQAQDAMSGPLPSDATLSIQGAAFPTVAAYALYEPDGVVRLLPDITQPLTAESRYSWIPNAEATTVKIDFLAFDPSGAFQGFPLSCWVRDDGSFELPDDIVEAVEESTFRLSVRYSRVYARLDVINGVVFHQRFEVSE